MILMALRTKKLGFDLKSMVSFYTVTYWLCKRTVQAHLVSLCVTDPAFLHKLTVFGDPERSKSTGAVFPAACARFVSVSHFGNSHGISNFMIIIFVMVTCDQ